MPSHSKAQYVNWLCTGSRNRTVANDTGHSINSTEITIEHPQSIEPDIEMVDYSYVQLAKTRTAKHDYTYPSLDIIAKVATTSTQSSNQVALEKYNSTGSLRRVSINEISNLGAPPAVPLPLKIRSKRKDMFRKPASRRLTSGARSRCIYCHEVFAQEENWRGSCRDAPDESARCIEKLSCMCCVQAVLYHCMSDSDGVYHHPCSCDSSDRNNGRRWVAMAFLSLIVPCLWCYLPLKICHACGTRCRCCGGRHKSAWRADRGTYSLFHHGSLNYDGLNIVCSSHRDELDLNVKKIVKKSCIHLSRITCIHSFVQNHHNWLDLYVKIPCNWLNLHVFIACNWLDLHVHIHCLNLLGLRVHLYYDTKPVLHANQVSCSDWLWFSWILANDNNTSSHVTRVGGAISNWDRWKCLYFEFWLVMRIA